MTDLQLILAKARATNTRPNADVFHAIGVEVDGRLVPDRSFTEIAERIGTTPQLARYHTLVALGKLTWFMRTSVGQRGAEEAEEACL